MRVLRRIVPVLLSVAMVASIVSPAVAAPKVAPKLPPQYMGTAAYHYVEVLNSAPRVAGTAGEVVAAAKIKAWFAKSGLKPYYQPFTFEAWWDGETHDSQNVIAYLPAAKKHGHKKPAPLVIVGAHYDNSVEAGLGADDNASGVGVMLEVAQRIARYKPEYDIAFVAFGAEEAGLLGSDYFVSQMDPKDVARTVAMINFDSLIVGDKLYIHAGANEKTGPRDEMLRLIKRYKLPIEMQPGLNPHYPAGLTPDGFSDYTAFNQAGIPVVAFESTNWEIGDLDGYEQTEQYGSFWHTENDVLATIEQMLPGRPMVRLDAYTKLVFEYLKHLNP